PRPCRRSRCTGSRPTSSSASCTATRWRRAWRRRAWRSWAMMILSSPSRKPMGVSFGPSWSSAMHDELGLPQLADGSVVTVGAFDGVHIGHREIVHRLTQRADARGLPALLVTFRPHPLAVVNATAAPMLLTPDEEQIDALV